MDKENLTLEAIDNLSTVELRAQCRIYNIRIDTSDKRSVVVRSLFDAMMAEKNANGAKKGGGRTIQDKSKVENKPIKEEIISEIKDEIADFDEKSVNDEKESQKVIQKEQEDDENQVLSEETTDESESLEEDLTKSEQEYKPSKEPLNNHSKQTISYYEPRPNRQEKQPKWQREKDKAVAQASKKQQNPHHKVKIQEQKQKPDVKNETTEEVVEKEVDLSTCEIRSGVIELCQDGFGFLRGENYKISSKDSFVPSSIVRKFGIRVGDFVVGYAKRIENSTKPPAIVKLIEINGREPIENYRRPYFENFVPIYPDELIRLEIKGKRNDLAVRAIDLIAPIGKGQRAMVVSPPKAGKTTLLKMIANSISINHPECKLLVLLIDERPEEVTDMQRSINGEVIYSTFDEESGNHIKIADLVLTRAKRLVEEGHDVVILLDSLTRMARANNVIVPSSGKTLSGGVDPVALYFPKRFFGAARNIENGGSLTIIATALVDTGSRMDDIVYEEFKGTGNMEIHLDRRLSEKRIFPAIDLYKSGTRREELLLSQQELEAAYLIRKLLSAGDPQEAAESIITMMMRTSSNAELTLCLKEQIAKLKKDGYRF